VILLKGVLLFLVPPGVVLEGVRGVRGVVGVEGVEGVE
jgi:hypothetical protein